MNREELVRSLIQFTASGRLDSRHVQPVLRSLLGQNPAPVPSGALLEALLDLDDPAARTLAAHLGDARRKDALTHHSLRSRGQSIPDDLRESLQDLPLDAKRGWSSPESGLAKIQSLLRLLGDRFFFSAHRDKAPATAITLEKKYQEALDGISGWKVSSLLDMIAEVERQAHAGRLDLSKILPSVRQSVARKKRLADEAAERALSTPDSPLPSDLDADVFLSKLSARMSQAPTREERRRLLDLACTWPTDGVVPLLQDLPEWAQDRATIILTLRFGQPAQTTWASWRAWLQGQAGGKGLAGQGTHVLVGKRPLALLYLWYSRQPDADRDALAALEQLVSARLETVTLEDFVDRWLASIPPSERKALTGASESEVRFVDEPKPAPVNPYVPAAKAVEPSRPPPKPSVWDVHLKPFFLENWYMVAGVAMVLVGSSLLAYFTWNKGWLLRYTIMPSLLGSFTMVLAWLGGWIERKDAQFKGTGAVLRGAAIGLLPINFMAVALLANDGDVGKYRTLAVPIMGAIYLGLFGRGLWKWSSAVHPGLGTVLGGTVLFLNVLVMLAGAKSAVAPKHLLPVIGTGFYFGFFVLMAAVMWFSRKILNGELAKDKRVVWFFGAGLTGTFVQVFAWVHGYLRYLPEVQTYASMVVLTGWLVLSLERRTLELRGEAEKHGAESFLGFAFILLGVLMGIGHQHVRILTLVLAGATWLVQSLPRRQPLHHWIGLTFLVLGGASVGLLRHFPPTALPTLGIGLALALGGFILLARSHDGLRQAAAGMQGAVLILTVIVTILAQQRFGTARFLAAGHLAAVAALFGVRAWRDGKIRWVQTAMVVLALAIPYLARTDFDRQALHSTTIVFGLAALSLLWIGATLIVRSPLLLGARSTVLWIYGAMAIACMAMRAMIDPAAAADAAWLDLGGPLVMTVALVWASYFSRSLIPAGMAMVIGLILIPELKDHLQKAYPNLGWGTGFGSMLTALGLTIASFFLRRAPALRNLGEGDLYMGKTPYPLRRLDSTLFTLPMLASAGFLILKVETWNLFSHLAENRFPLKLAGALFVSGIVWTLFAVFHRGRPASRVASFAGLLWMIVGIAAAVPSVIANPDVSTIALAPALFVQAAYFFHRFYLQPRQAWAEGLLTKPTLGVLRLGSLLFAVACIGGAIFGADPRETFGMLAAFTAVELAWHGLHSRRLIFGFALFAVDLTTLLAWVDRATMAVTAMLGLVIAVQVLQSALEFRKASYDYLRPLMVPFQGWASVLALAIGLGTLGFVNDTPGRTLQVVLTIVALLLSARALSSGPLALLAVLVSYVLLEARQAGTADFRIVMATPSKASLLAFTLAVLGHAGRRLYGLHPAILSGAFTPRAMKWPVVPWMFLPAVVIACVVSFHHAADPLMRERADQLWAPYAGAATLAVIAFSTRLLPIYHGAGVLLTLGNVHLVRIVLGPLLRKHGLSEIHLVGLGVALTLLQGTLIRLTIRKVVIARLVHRASLVLAGLLLVLISANYLVHPNLEVIGPLRFAVSGAMSLLAGIYFRRAARHPAPGEEPIAVWCEGFYHFGVTMAFWCAALMIPALRHPVTALVALAVPALYFHARAESGRSARYRISSATLSFVVLALYVFRGIVQMILFPDARFDTTTYHANSPVIFVLGLVLLRLHALGGSSWFAFYGGLATMASAYFALTALPGLSPFQHAEASAWCAIGMAHFFTLASLRQSPIRAAVQRLAAIDAERWQELRRPWGLCLLAASQATALYGIVQNRSFMAAPLIVGAASVLIHQGILRQSKVYSLLAQVEIAIALHVGFLGVPSLLQPDHVVWAILGLWAALLAARPLISRLDSGWEINPHAGILAGLTLGHVLAHRPWSTAGLWAFALGTVLAALTPRRTRSPESVGETITAMALPWAPAWLAWFSQLSRGTEAVPGLFRAWPVLATAATLLATGGLALLLQKGWAERYLRAARLRPMLFDHTVAWLGRAGVPLYRLLLWGAFLATGLVQAIHWGLRFDVREVALLEGLWAAFAVAWLFEGRSRKAMTPFFLMEICALGAFLVAREQLHLTRGVWKYDYDIWAALAAFFGLVGAKQLLEDRSREVQVPITSALLSLPIFSATWIALHHLGTDLGLLVVGLHSAAFVYLGKEDRESPYHLVAIGGFIAFVTLMFWSKLHLRMVYAYVVPVGTGVLALLQLFRARVPEEGRNGIRAVTLLAMLASAGWSALLDPGFPLLHNVVLLGLCLAAMTLGGLLRIRMYVALGFGALMIDLLALMAKAVAHLERTVRMTMVGSLVLVVGAGLVFGAIYYKTHKQEIAGLLERWRLRFSGWE